MDNNDNSFLPEGLTLEDLNSLLNTAKKLDLSTLSYDELTHHIIKQFIKAKDIKESSYHVPMRVVFDKYLVWCVEKEYTPTHYTHFTTAFAQYFPKVKMASANTFKINPESMDLPEYYRVNKDIRFTKDKDSRYINENYHGVFKFGSWYIARIELENGLHYLGDFKSAKDAAFYYDINAVYHFSNKAILNYPEKFTYYDKILKETKKPISRTEISGTKRKQSNWYKKRSD